MNFFERSSKKAVHTFMFNEFNFLFMLMVSPSLALLNDAVRVIEVLLPQKENCCCEELEVSLEGIYDLFLPC